ncbi:MAG: hypothetical protein WCY75_01360 [Sulfurimonadaceae bacterium]|jgi:hypothetical protein|nr:hypothetical protein [Arcobacteraceae bacterium]
MIRFLLLLILLLCKLNAYSTKAINAYAVSIYDENFKEENIQRKQKTTQDYNGIVYTKIYAFGQFFHDKPNVQIGTSKGTLIQSNAIVKNGLLIGQEMIFKHTTVTKGYLEVYVGKKLFDRSLYVK